MKKTSLLALPLLLMATASFANLHCSDGDTDISLRTDSKGTVMKYKGKKYEVTGSHGLGDGTEDVYLQNSTDEMDKLTINCEVAGGGAG